MRTIGVVTVARSDYGIYLPILRRIKAADDLHLSLFVTGMHLSPEFGLTVNEIEADDFKIQARVEMLLSSDTAEGVAKSMGLGVIGFAQAYARFRPDILMVLGDRFEMFSAVAAAQPFNIPIAHVHGGESTQGAVDEAFRHAITKMSHLHFVSTEAYRKRVIQLGEEPWRVIVSGAPGLDNLNAMPLLSNKELVLQFGLSLSQPPLLVTFHPVTLEQENSDYYITELLAALAGVNAPIIFTYPNADTDGRIIINKIDQFVATHANSQVVMSLGAQAYFSVMKQAAAMVGNSSSGIIEAPSFALPVVNIGSRQQGRVRAANVIDVGYKREEIVQGIERALHPQFRDKISTLNNPYHNGIASEKIVDALTQVQLDNQLIMKPFYDLQRPS